MPFRRLTKRVLRIIAIPFAVYLVLVTVVYLRQRSMLFFPTHSSLSAKLTPWSDGTRTIGYSRYQLLRSQNQNTNMAVCVLGESIGTGPACSLAREKTAPDKIVLVVPFDTLASVASRRFFFLPVRLLLRDCWDNVESLRHYAGPVEIFGAIDDTIIPIEHAKALARQIPSARFTAISGGHNEWSENKHVKIAL